MTVVNKVRPITNSGWHNLTTCQSTHTVRGIGPPFQYDLSSLVYPIFCLCGVCYDYKADGDYLISRF